MFNRLNKVSYERRFLCSKFSKSQTNERNRLQFKIYREVDILRVLQIFQTMTQIQDNIEEANDENSPRFTSPFRSGRNATYSRIPPPTLQCITNAAPNVVMRRVSFQTGSKLTLACRFLGHLATRSSLYLGPSSDRAAEPVKLQICPFLMNQIERPRSYASTLHRYLLSHTTTESIMGIFVDR